MIPRSEWADKDRDKIYSLSDIVEILDFEIKCVRDASLKNSDFKRIYNAFKKCALWIEDIDYAREDIDLHKVLNKSGEESFSDLFENFVDTVSNSNIPSIDNLIIDLSDYYNDFQSLDYEIEYD